MKLVFPTIEYKEKAIDYIKEFHEYNSEINGTGNLDYFLQEESYEAWLESVLAHVDIANVPEDSVPAITYLYVREEDDCVVGMVNIRLALNDFLRKEGGNIGYSIRPTERRKNYATELLKAAVDVCNRIGIHEVLVACNKENVASAGVIKNCGGVLKDEFFSETYQEMTQMYCIDS